MKNPCMILWLRNDLRLHDHEALTLLANTAEILLPVYCLNPRDFDITPLGFSRTGSLSVRFLLDCLENLRTALQARGSDLHVVVGTPEIVIPALVKECNASVIFTERQILGEAVQVERRLAAALEPLGVPLRSYWVNTLIHPNELPFPIANLPDHFEQFHEAVGTVEELRAPLPSPEQLPAFPAGIETVEPIIPFQSVDPAAAALNASDLALRGGESVALAHLEDYAQGRRVSSATLRGETGNPENARPDRFDPWLAYGALSPRQIYQQVKYSGLEAWAGELASGVIENLLYRDYCRLLAIRRSGRIGQASGDFGERAKERFERWCAGETGEAFVDAHLRELAQTGYPSVYGQRLAASYLYHELRLNWRWGAAWFTSRLLDNDPCVNLALWMGVTGLWRIDERPSRLDPAEQAAQRDPDGAYVRRWLSASLATDNSSNRHTSS